MEWRPATHVELVKREQVLEAILTVLLSRRKNKSVRIAKTQVEKMGPLILRVSLDPSGAEAHLEDFEDDGRTADVVYIR